MGYDHYSLDKQNPVIEIIYNNYVYCVFYSHFNSLVFSNLQFGTSPPVRTPDNTSKPVTPSLPFNSKKPDPQPTTIFKIPLRKLKSKNIELSISDNSDQFYNGMGGHSKHDLFPTPRIDKFKKLTKKKNLSASAKPFSKKRKSDTNLSTLDSFITI